MDANSSSFKVCFLIENLLLSAVSFFNGKSKVFDYRENLQVIIIDDFDNGSYSHNKFRFIEAMIFYFSFWWSITVSSGILVMRKTEKMTK